jgi:hypothetical protein
LFVYDGQERDSSRNAVEAQIAGGCSNRTTKLTSVKPTRKLTQMKPTRKLTQMKPIRRLT